MRSCFRRPSALCFDSQSKATCIELPVPLSVTELFSASVYSGGCVECSRAYVLLVIYRCGDVNIWLAGDIFCKTIDAGVCPT